MTNNSIKKIPLYIQVALVANILLFFSFGIRYLIVKDTGNFIGIMLILAGLSNIFLLLFKFSKKNYFFMFLNFIFAVVSFIVLMDFWQNKVPRIIWIIVTLYYLITAFYLMYQVKKRKNDAGGV